MGLSLIKRYSLVALSVVGSAILLISCDKTTSASEPSLDAMLSEYSENISMIRSENGRRSLIFQSPLVEGYTLGSNPYREFRRGIRVTTFNDDSLSTINVILDANYAIYYENRQLWEARGDVVVRKSDGKTLYTQQLFWNLVTKRVYSNVDSKVVENGGRDVAYGEGFETDETFKDVHWRKLRSMMTVNVSSLSDKDSSDSTRRVSTIYDEPIQVERPPVGKVGTEPGTASDVKRERSAERTSSIREKAVASPEKGRNANPRLGLQSGRDRQSGREDREDREGREGRASMQLRQNSLKMAPKDSVRTQTLIRSGE